MGGKQSTPTHPTTATSSQPTTSSRTNNSISHSQLNTSSLHSSRASPGIGHPRFSTHLINRNANADRSGRQNRSSSAREPGARIPRSGLEWFFASSQLLDGNASADTGIPGSSSSGIHPLAHRGNLSRSLPPFLLRPNRDARCPMCHKMIPAEDVEVHFVMCLTKPRVTYNEDIMSTTGGECSICLEELQEGETIARLPCLCVYHKVCIDKWFLKSQTCPEHPPD